MAADMAFKLRVSTVADVQETPTHRNEIKQHLRSTIDAPVVAALALQE